jgi:hypothetical protein
MTNQDQTALAVREEAPASLTVFGTSDPVAILERVEQLARPLATFINDHNMSKVLASAARKAKAEREGQTLKRYVMIEGWSFMGAMLGVAPRTVEVRELLYPNGALRGFEADAELVMRDGLVAAAGTAECTYDEKTWLDREPFALKSMAQTRAAGKAFRMGLGFIMAAAGFEATPAEEMVEDEERPTASGQAAQQARAEQQRGGRPETIEEVLSWAFEAHGLSTGQVLEILGIDRETLQKLHTDTPENMAASRAEAIQRARAKIAAAMDRSAPAAEPPLEGEVVEAEPAELTDQDERKILEAIETDAAILAEAAALVEAETAGEAPGEPEATPRARGRGNRP